MWPGKMRPIFCGNFEYDARQSDLERLFGRYGKVERVDMKSGEISCLPCVCLVLCFFVFLFFEVILNIHTYPKKEEVILNIQLTSQKKKSTLILFSGLLYLLIVIILVLKPG